MSNKFLKKPSSIVVNDNGSVRPNIKNINVRKNIIAAVKQAKKFEEAQKRQSDTLHRKQQESATV